jgi:hypothetical protein
MASEADALRSRLRNSQAVYRSEFRIYTHLERILNTCLTKIKQTRISAIIIHNQQDAWNVEMRQQKERGAIIFQQLETHRALQSRIERLESLKTYRLDELEHDKSQYQAIREKCLEQLEIQRREQNRDRPRSPEWMR